MREGGKRGGDFRRNVRIFSKGREREGKGREGMRRVETKELELEL